MTRRKDDAAPVEPEANAWGTVQDIEDALDDYVSAHPEWRTQPSGALVEEISGLINNLYDAGAGGPHVRRRPSPKPRDPKSGADDIPI